MQAGEEAKVSYHFIISDPLHAPLKAGERIGELQIRFEHELIGLVELLAAEDVKKITLWERLKQKIGRGV
jgi:hypothetical protein